MEASGRPCQVSDINKPQHLREEETTTSAVTQLANMYVEQCRWKDAEQMLLEIIERSKSDLIKQQKDIMNFMKDLATVSKAQRT